MSVFYTVRNKYPFWNATGGRNHFIVLSWDQAGEVFGYHSPARKVLQNAIQITTIGTLRKTDNFNPSKDIVVPPYIDRKVFMDVLHQEHDFDENRGWLGKRMLAYFRGTIVDDQRYSYGVRQYLWDTYKSENSSRVKNLLSHLS